MTTTRLRPLLLALPLLLAAGAAAAAVTAAPGFAVRTIPTPALVNGGVVAAGGAVLVGQGPSFTANAQSVVRLSGGAATTIATGFSSLGGFALAADGTLYVVDNAGELAGAATGDTVFAIPDALARTTAVAAADAAVLPAGSIPAAFDVAVAPDGALLVTDAAGPGAGSIVRVAGGTATPFAGGFDFTGGLALAGGTVFVANVDGSFVGAVRRLTSAGAPLPDLIGGLSGAYAVDVEPDGTVLVTGGFADDFTSTLVAVAPDGASVAERARGFAFTGELFHDAARDETLVLDFGVSEIVAICRDGDGDGVCDADDVCPAAADPGQEDADGDGLGDACDPCSAAALEEARLAFRKLQNGRPDDSLSLTGELAGGVAALAGVPATGIRITIGDAIDVELPGGAYDRSVRRGWKAKARRVEWKDKAGTFAGITAVSLAVPKRQPDTVKVKVKGKRVAYAVSLGAPPAHATVVLGPTGAACGDAAFDPAACKVNAKRGTLACR